MGLPSLGTPGNQVASQLPTLANVTERAQDKQPTCLCLQANNKDVFDVLSIFKMHSLATCGGRHL